MIWVDESGDHPHKTWRLYKERDKAHRNRLATVSVDGFGVTAWGSSFDNVYENSSEPVEAIKAAMAALIALGAI